MLAILVTVAIVTVALIALLWVGTVWAQGNFYDSPTDGLSWRAPAAAGSIAAFLFMWTLIEYSRPNTTDTLFRFTSEVSTPFDRFVSVRKTEDNQEQEIIYRRRNLGEGRHDFTNDKGIVWSRSQSGMMVAIIVEEKAADGSDVRTRFNAEMENGKFNPKVVRGIHQSLRYLEDGGNRTIIESQMGKVISYKRIRWIGSMLLNLLHFVLWFLALWLLLRFQWPHALGFAVVAWLAITLALTPYMLDRAREAAEKRATASRER